MRYLPLLLLLSGCIGPAMKPTTTIQSDPLYQIKNGGVNTKRDNAPPVTHMEKIRGELWIY